MSKAASLPPHIALEADRPGARAYASWILIALAYAVAFMQRLAPQSMLNELSASFSIEAAGLGVLASGYFYGYLAMQIPAGILVDTLGVRRVLIGSLLVSLTGTTCFAMAHSVPAAFAARLVIACGDALVFTSMLKLVALKFRQSRFGLMSGLSQVSGYIGGAMATTPLAYAVSELGWRECFAMVAGLIAFNLVAAILVFARTDQSPMALKELAPKLGRTLRMFRGRLRSASSWGCAVVFASHFASVTTLSGVWGLPMVRDTLSISKDQASTCILAFLVSNVAGSILLGHLSDRVMNVRRALLWNCLLRAAILLALLPALLASMGYAYAIACFCVLGFVAGGTVPLVLKAVRKLYSTEMIGIGASFNTTLAGITAAVVQPLIGSLLATSATGSPGHLSYTAQGYTGFVLLMAAVSALGCIGAAAMRFAHQA
ncbi:Major facilitator superfamily (MFS) profile domain-containing protein [Bordetella sputigena]|uniref:MFS transporter n=1 Tax=Bordetella sputigena TaxID=1416810 RepID=UPI0039EFE2C6